MGEIPMPGGWTMSMAWVRMLGQTWPGAAAAFLGMWVVMMVAMMLPSLVPMLWRYRPGRRQGRRDAPGSADRARERGLIAGALQFTAWKAHHLACCREAPGRGRTPPGDAGTAWRHGLRLGLHCGHCCANLMAILLVIGVMDLRPMAVVTAAITVERLAPTGERVTRAIGAVVVGQGCF
jgi:predicted metal-binding membrane protein